MPAFVLPAGAVLAALPDRLRLQLASPTPEPPDGDSWLHEIKHDGHRLAAIVAGDALTLLSRNIRDRTALFRDPFRPLLTPGLPSMVLDGEIAVPDARGVTHIDDLSAAIAERRPERFAYFAFDLLYLDGHDLRGCTIEDRKALLRDVIGAARGERLLYVDHVVGQGRALFEAVGEAGGEGVVSKRRGSLYRGSGRRDWLKTKVSDTGMFVATGFSELGPGRLEALYVAEERDGVLRPAGAVRFGLAGKGLWRRLDQRRAGPPYRGVVPAVPGLVVAVKFFGRYKAGWIRDGVLLKADEPGNGVGEPTR
jgi:bifunctional non-homologous end joining protein LigD